MRSFVFLFIVTWLIVAGGCSRSLISQADPATWPDLGRVAIPPFENHGATPRAGLITCELVTAAWRARGGVEPVPAEDLRSALAPRMGEELTSAELGQVLGADTLLLGMVTDYEYKQGLGQKPVVGLSLRLVEAATGRVLWSASEIRVGGVSVFAEDALGALAQDLASDLVATLPETVEAVAR